MEQPINGLCPFLYLYLGTMRTIKWHKEDRPLLARFRTKQCHDAFTVFSTRRLNKNPKYRNDIIGVNANHLKDDRVL